MSEEKLPPYSEEAEFAVLGAMINDPEYTMPLASKKSVGAEHFFLQHNASCFTVVNSLYVGGSAIDDVTVVNEAKRLGIDCVSWNLIDAVTEQGFSAHAESYMDILCDRFARRKVIDKANETLKVAYDLEIDAETVISQAEQSLHELRVEDRESKEYMEIKILDSYDKAAQGIVAGVPTPFVSMDEATGGIPLEAVTPFIGRSGAGKSMVKAAWAARLMSLGVGFVDFAMEDKARAMSRLAGCIAQASDFHLRKGSAHADSRARMEAALKKVRESDLAHFRSKKRDINGICSQIRYHADAFGIKIAWVDGFKDIKRPAKYHNDTGYEEHLSQMLTDVAEQCNVAICPVIHLKKIEKDKVIEEGDMRGSSLLNSDARCLLALQDQGIAEAFSAKNVPLLPEGRVMDMLKNNYGTRIKVAFNMDFDMQSVRNV